MEHNANKRAKDSSLSVGVDDDTLSMGGDVDDDNGSSGSTETIFSAVGDSYNNMNGVFSDEASSNDSLSSKSSTNTASQESMDSDDESDESFGNDIFSVNSEESSESDESNTTNDEDVQADSTPTPGVQARFHHLQELFELCSVDKLDIALCSPVLEEDHTFAFRRCQNCQRSGNSVMIVPPRTTFTELDAYTLLHMVVLEKEDIRSANCSFNNLKKPSLGPHATVCWQCYNVVSKKAYAARGKQKLDGELHGWPSFIHSVLFSPLKRSPFETDLLWALVPMHFRQWWWDAIKGKPAFVNSKCTLESPIPVVKDVTAARGQWDRVSKSLHAVPTFALFDEVCALPQVKCPWGCSEFLNRCNKVSLDVVYTKCLEEYMDMAPKSFCSKKAHLNGFGESMRKDFLVSGHPILGNPEWLCCPRLCFDSTFGPQFLSCRIHTDATTKRYIHVPLNPLGPIASRGDNQFAMAVPKPRIARAVHMKKYSNSYQTAVINSRYDGINTMVFGLSGRHDMTTRLSSIRDYIQVEFRPDVKNHMKLMAKGGKLPKELVEYIIEDSKTIAKRGDHLQLGMAADKTMGATYMSMEDAMRLHSYMRTDTEQRVTLPSGRDCWFKPTWLPLVLHLHPCNGFGAKFPRLPRVSSPKSALDLRITWVLFAMMTSSTVVWRETNQSLKSVNQWQGWCLHLCAEECAVLAKCRGSQNNPFKTMDIGTVGVKNKNERLTKFIIDLYNLGNQYIFSGSLMGLMFADVDGVLPLDWNQFCYNGGFDSLDDDIHEQYDAIIFFQNMWGATTNTILPESWEQWELKSVIGTHPLSDKGPGAFTGYNYCRHGSVHGRNWWIRKQVNNVRARGNNTLKCPVVDGNLYSGAWDVAIFENSNSTSTKSAKIKYLQCSGFQTKVRCRHHKMPLAANPKTVKKLCSMCGKVATLICCPISGNDCAVAVCRKHEKELTLSNQPIIYVDGEQFVGVAVDDDGSLESDEESVTLAPPMLSAEEEQLQAGLITHQNVLIDDQSEDVGYNENPLMEVQELSFPTTHAGLENFECEWPAEYVGSQVIFNKLGRMLIRKDRKFEPSNRNKHWLQGVISNSCTNSVPLVYAEGSVFPSHFWYSLPDGSIVGAIPTALLTDNYTLSKLNFATVHDHMLLRMTDCSQLSSTDVSYKLFAFDACLNLGSRGSDTRINMRRGWDALTTKGEGIKVDEEDASLASQVIFQGEQLENSVVCDKIAAALKRKMASLFLTFTLNQKGHFGMRLLKNWLDSDSCTNFTQNHVLKPYMDALNHTMTREDSDTLKAEVVSSSSTLAMRMWENAWQLFRNYIVNSPEKPLGGTVEHLVDRSELQDQLKAGNLPHHHLIAWLKEDDGSKEARNAIVKNIRGSVMHLVETGEIAGLIQEGVVSSYEALVDVLGELELFLSHIHTSRCMIPTNQEGLGAREMPKTCDGYADVEELFKQGYRCKVVDNHRISPNPNKHCFIKMERPHCEQAKAIFRELGLLWTEENEYGEEVEVLHDWLVAETHIPPTTAEHAAMSPVLARLALLNPSNQNVQYLDSILAARYLTKYVIKIDEANRVFVTVPTSKNPDTHSFQPENMPNTKITSVAMDQEKNTKRKNQCIARVIGDPEVTMLLLNMESVHMTHVFVHVSSVPMEERPAFDRSPPASWMKDKGVIPANAQGPSDVDTNRVVYSQSARQTWPPNLRRFKETALLQARDECFSPLTMDSVTVFSVRPPELYFVRHQKVYHECFVRKKICLKKETGTSHFDLCMKFCGNQLNREYGQCSWIDGTFYHIFVRAAALPRLLAYVKQCTDKDFAAVTMPNPKRRITRFFTTLNQMNLDRNNGIQMTRIRCTQWSRACQKFITCLNDKDYPVVYFTMIKPKLANRFLIHVLLTMGKFTTELDLTLSGSIRNAFIAAELFDSNDAEDSVRQILKDYLLNQIPEHCSSTRGSDETLIQAYDVLKEALLLNDNATALATVGDPYPSVFYTRLREKATEEVMNNAKVVRTDLAKFLLLEAKRMGLSNLPSVEDVVNSTFAHFDNPIWDSSAVTKTPVQPQESFEEQQKILARARTTVRSLLLHCHIRHPKSLCTVGGPGCGKTAVNLMALLDAMCLGNQCLTTALLSDRANQLAGIHFHRLFCIPADSAKSGGVGHIARTAIRNLYSWGAQNLHLLKSLDVLLIDELGQWPAKYIAIMDIILRKIRKSNKFLGGVLVLSTYDIFQLLPIHEIPPLLSGHMMTSFQFAELKHSVRAANDAPLRELNSLTRIPPDEYTSQHIERVKFLITNICTFVTSFNDPAIPPNTMFVFGKKAPGRERRDEILKELDQRHNLVKRKAEDCESTYAGEWKIASQATSNLLDNKTKEDQSLFFVQGMVFQTTEVKGHLYNSNQLCILWEEPLQADVDAFKPIAFLLAPPGVKEVPAIDEKTTKEDFVAAGWSNVLIGVCRESSRSLKNRLKGKRKQYALRLHVTSTLHGAMGATFGAVCSKVDMDPKSPFALWERAQAIVLLSRTKEARNIFFVGDKHLTAQAIVNVLLARSQYFDYMRHVLKAFLTEGEDIPGTATIELSRHPFRPIDVELPSDTSGCCYLLSSLIEPDVTYIGETMRLGERLDEHNSGSGAIQTSSKFLQKWALVAFVTGFDYDVDARKRFEKQWQYSRDSFQRNHGRYITTEEIIGLGENLASDKRGLRVVVCSRRVNTVS